MVEDEFSTRECTIELDLSYPVKENYVHKFKSQLFDFFSNIFWPDVKNDELQPLCCSVLNDHIKNSNASSPLLLLYVFFVNTVISLWASIFNQFKQVKNICAPRQQKYWHVHISKTKKRKMRVWWRSSDSRFTSWVCYVICTNVKFLRLILDLLKV